MASLPILSRLLAVAALLFLPIHAQEPGSSFAFPGASGKAASTSKLVAELSTIAPGSSFSVALNLSHPDEWHSYYQNSGGIETSPSITWTLPDGFTAGPLQFPVPHVIDGITGKSFVYSGSPTFLVTITAPDDLQVGTQVTLQAEAKWQICKNACLDESGSYELKFATASEAVKDTANVDLFSEARAEQPAAPESWTMTAEPVGKDFGIRLSYADGDAPDLSAMDIEFVPDFRYIAPFSQDGTIAKDGDDWLITLKRITVDALDLDVEQGSQVGGILIADANLDGGKTAVHFQAVEMGRAPAKPLPLSAFLPILGGMFLGGLILNLMPCVFPVIGLKIMGFVQQSGEDKKKIVLHGIAFTIGVLLSFWALSGVLFALRSAAAPGQEIGWGYQLQNPWTVLVLMLLMFVMGLSMYGVFEIGASATGVGGKLQSKQGVGGSFFSGILATVVATPCSAPFLGAAIGTAIALPPAQFFMSFTAMGLGLSLPYLVLSIFPKLVDLLPRPGAWMESFKQAMSFLLFATAGFLLWVYAGQIGLENMLNVVFGLTAIAIAGWIFGRWFTPIRSKNAKIVAIGLCLLFTAMGLKLSIPPEKSSLAWEKWSDERVKELLEEGTPVYVDFTAQWCATCQLNKKRAYPEEVAKLIESHGIVLLKGDKTSANPAIDAKLEELGRSAIPVNVLYVPDKEPIITPELLDAKYMTELIKREVPLPED